MAIIGGPTVTLKFKGDKDDLDRTIAGIETSLARLGTASLALGAGIGILGSLGAAAGAVVAAVAAIPAGFLAIGVAVAAHNEEVKARFTQLKDHVMSEMGTMTASIRTELLAVADQLTAAFDRMSPALTRIFEASAPHLKIFTDGLINLVEKALPGFEVAIGNATPLVEALARGMGTLGQGIGDMFAELSTGVPGATVALDALFGLVSDLLVYLGQLVAQLANALGPAFAAIAPVIMDVVRALGDGLMIVVQELAPLLGPLANMIGEILRPAFDALFAILQPVIHSLVEGLKPVIPVVTEAFQRMAPTIMEIAQRAGPLLATAIDALAPLFLALVQAALDLTEALLPVIPPLLDMANNAMPLVKGVITDVLIPAIQWLVREFVGLIDYGAKIADSMAQLSVRWRTYWDEIKAAFADAYAKMQAGIEWFASLGEKARAWFDGMVVAIRTKLDEAKAAVNAFPEQVHQALANAANYLLDRGRELITGLWNGAKEIWNQVIEWIKKLPSEIVTAIGDTSKTLYNSGASLIDGFNQGIESKREAAKAAGIDAVGATESVFPQSPPKEGPFSGSGWTYYRGQSLIDGFIQGIGSMWSKARDMVSQGLGGLSGQISSGLQQIQSFIGGLGIDTNALLNMARNATVGIGPGGQVAASMGGVELRIAPGADSALSSMLMNLVRTGQLQLARA